ncbi:MAG: IS200/IS605 family transposase [Pyrinomonadaceae bacterium]
MSRRAYSEINLHLTWHVKESLPIINETFEEGLHRHLRSYALKEKDVIVHEVGGTETHVHMAVSIPPTLQIAEWIGRLKGSSSHHVNHQLVNRHLLGWQDGYGVVSFGTKDLSWIVDYTRNQKEHHRNGTRFERLERFSIDG